MSASTLPRSATAHVRSAAVATGRKLHLTSPSKATVARGTATKSAKKSAKAGRDTVTDHPKATGSALGSLVLAVVATLLLLRRRRGDSNDSNDSN